MDTSTLIALKSEVEKVFKRDTRFGSLHRLEENEHNELLLVWDNAALRPKSKANPGPYLAFMEELSDCLADFGYCLAADEEANENAHNNYLLIVAEDEADFEDE